MDDQNKIIARLAGAVLLIFGAALAGLFMFGTQRLIALGQLAKLNSVLAIGSIGLIACFCIVVGYRLALDRPNRNQSVLPPMGWYALTLIFVIFAVAAGIALLRKADYTALIAIGAVVLMGAGCLKAGRRAALRGTAEPVLPRQDESAPVLGKPQGWRIGAIGTTTLHVHWSLPMGGLLVSAMTGFAFPAAIYNCVFFTLLIVLHECGHIVAARAYGLQVNSVEISGLGGMCFIQVPHSVGETLAVFSAGLAVQTVILLVTILYVSVAGYPASVAGQCAVRIFTFVNAAIIVMNILPAKVRWGFANDGLVLWRLFLHVWKGQPFPFALKLDETILFPPDTRLHLLDSFARAGFTTGIEILNDATTPMEFVVAVLKQHLDVDREAAIAMMLCIHRTGGVLVPVEGHARSVAIAAAITADARGQGHPLVCRDVTVPAASTDPGTTPG